MADNIFRTGDIADINLKNISHSVAGAEAALLLFANFKF